MLLSRDVWQSTAASCASAEICEREFLRKFLLKGRWVEPDDVLWRALMVETRVKSQDCCRCSSLRPRTIQLDGPPRAGAYRQGKPCAIMCFPMSDISNEVD